MDNTAKYTYLKHNGKNPFEIVEEIISNGYMPLHAVKKIREIFPFLSLEEAKEIVVIATSEYKSLYNYQGSLLPDLEKLDEELDEGG